MVLIRRPDGTVYFRPIEERDSAARQNRITQVRYRPRFISYDLPLFISLDHEILLESSCQNLPSNQFIT